MIKRRQSSNSALNASEQVGVRGKDLQPRALLHPFPVGITFLMSEVSLNVPKVEGFAACSLHGTCPARDEEAPFLTG